MTLPSIVRACIAGVAVAAGGIAFAAPTADAAAHAELSRWLTMHSERFAIKPVGPPPVGPPPADVPSGEIEWSARPIAAAAPTARMQVWVDARVAGRPWRAVPVAFDVQAYRAAWLATHDARIGESIARAALERRVVDVAAAATLPLAEPPADARLRRPLLAGQAVTAAHVEPTPAVQRGAPVLVQARVGAIGIEARAEALQDGQAGSQVWVRLATSTAPVRARVVAAGIVEVGHE